ncbi:MAG: hypothetical protein JNL82_08395 [Myxococcales bacterium]|nr:hypothetical protein [Myxococcales bacterium]
MTPRLRKLALTVHVVASVGWFGAVAAFLGLAVAGLTSPDPEFVRAACLAMEAITWTVLVPLSLASLLTGLLSSLGTSWGLLRHYWVLVKLLLTCGATLLLLLHTQPIGLLARMAVQSTQGPEFRGLQIQLVVDASLAMVVLLVTTVLGIFKPKGLTPYGRRKQGAADENTSTDAPRWVRVFAILAIVIVVIVLHKLMGGMHRHS